MNKNEELFIDYRTTNPNEIVKAIVLKANAMGLQKKKVEEVKVKPEFGKGITITMKVSENYYQVGG